jgi:hypothetical protein
MPTVAVTTYDYYNGDFEFPRQPKLLPWGTGPVLIVGKPYASKVFNKVAKKHERLTSLKDMIVFDAAHEKKGSPTYIAPTVEDKFPLG